jgi:hypothetical protein
MDERADAESLRQGVRERYRDVALNPDGSLGSCTGRPLAAKLGYPSAIVDAIPDRAVASFAGVNRHSSRATAVRLSRLSVCRPAIPLCRGGPAVPGAAIQPFTNGSM